MWAAVNGMLPKNKLRKERMSRLHLFPTTEHPYAANIYKQLEPPGDVKPKLPPLFKLHIGEEAIAQSIQGYAVCTRASRRPTHTPQPTQTEELVKKA